MEPQRMAAGTGPTRRSRRAPALRWLAAAVLLVALGSSEVRAGAWTRKQGSVYLRLSSKLYQADKYFDSGGNRTKGDWWDPKAEFLEFSTHLLGEVGIIDQLTFSAEGTAKFMRSDYSRGIGGKVSVDGFSDAVLGLRYGPYQRNLVAAVEAKLEIPTGYPRDDTRVSLGTGHVNAQFKTLFGGGLPIGFGNYFDTSFGYRVRGGGDADDLLFSAAVGVETFDDLWFRVGTSGVFNLGAEGTSSTGNQDASYLGIGGALTYLFDFGFGIEIAGAADAWGRNSFAGWGLELVLQFEHQDRRQTDVMLDPVTFDEQTEIPW